MSFTRSQLAGKVYLDSRNLKGEDLHIRRRIITEAGPKTFEFNKTTTPRGPDQTAAEFPVSLSSENMLKVGYTARNGYHYPDPPIFRVYWTRDNKVEIETALTDALTEDGPEQTPSYVSEQFSAIKGGRHIHCDTRTWVSSPELIKDVEKEVGQELTVWGDEDSRPDGSKFSFATTAEKVTDESGEVDEWEVVSRV